MYFCRLVIKFQSGSSDCLIAAHLNTFSSLLRLRPKQGHGLDKDLEIINMFIPPYQLVDTVNIFRKENSRKISLRFLANYLLGRDMQQDTHDSVEDAKIAYEIYLTALRLISQGRFNQVLDDIYEYGRKNEWRLGLDD